MHDARGLKAAGDPLTRYNVVWNSPSLDEQGAMPAGNGDIGLNVWVEDGGDLLFYIGKTDAWAEALDSDTRPWPYKDDLLKVGRVRVSLRPNPFVKGQPFEQALNLRRGGITVRAGAGDGAVHLRVWVDANRPVIHVEAESRKLFGIRAKVESWRKRDIILPVKNGRVAWCFRNERSTFPERLKAQAMDAVKDTYPDPMLGRTFGCVMSGNGMAAAAGRRRELASTKAARQFDLQVHVLTAQTATAEGWRTLAEKNVSEANKVGLAEARRQHRRWWDEFWNRSWIRAGGPADAEDVSRAYVLQRWMNACGGRGAYPIKFNGSIFTAGWDSHGQKGKPDARLWGPRYWFQNTRLIYWPMLASGDLDLLEPFFRMYQATLPVHKAATRAYYRHDGANICETMGFWGESDRWACKVYYGTMEWQGGLEITAVMLDRFRNSRDRAFARNTLLPFAHEIVTFYDQHYIRDENGKLLIWPAQALETWWICTNPMPEVAGLKVVLEGLLGLPKSLTSKEERDKWQRMLSELPLIPTRKVKGREMLAPAEQFRMMKNLENPELYAVFPYRVYGVGKPDIELAQRAFRHRLHKGSKGWQQDDTQAAFLGLTHDARRMITERARSKFGPARFPAIWGPNFDWIPDQCHGGNLMMALQTMLMQCEGKLIRLFPAWPKDWDVEFKLHAPYRTTVEGKYRGGKLESLRITPGARASDVEIVPGKVEPRSSGRQLRKSGASSR